MNLKSFNVLASVIIGNIILAAAVAAFVIPHNLVMGGATGLGLTINHYLPEIELSMIIFAVNIILFILGALTMGKKFALTTIISTILYPVFLGVMQRMPGIENVTDNVLLAVIYNGLLIGLGVAMIIRVGSSTGGSDIIALIMNKKMHISLAVGVYLVDFVIIALQMSYSTAEQIMYGVLVLIIVTIVIGKVTVLGQSQIQLFIISEKYDEIKENLLNQHVVGATMVKIETGRQGKEQNAVLCIIPNRKLYTINEAIHQIDSHAFVTISQIHEVRGRGFTMDRIYEN